MQSKRITKYMTLFTISMAVILFSASIGPNNVSFAESPPDDKHAPDKLLVKFKPNVAKSSQDQILKENNAKQVHEISKINLKVLSVPSNALEKIKSQLEKHPLVEYVEPDYYFEPTETIPNDELFSLQWHHENLKSSSAWGISTGSPNAPIAILDSGIDKDHPDLSQKILRGYNFYDNTSDVTDFCGHGTLVAGVAAAQTDNSIGVAGVAWENPIMPIKITKPDCWGTYSAIIEGIIYAADNGARVANISYLIFNGEAITDAAKYLHDQGGVVVASAGNTGKFEDYEDSPYIISVGATDVNNNVVSFSSKGPYVDFVAPGLNIYTTTNGGGYAPVSGTSFSAPIASGVIALLYSHDQTLSSPQVYEILKNSSTDSGEPGRDYEYGWGIINPVLALSEIETISDDTIPPEITVPLDITQSATATHLSDGGTAVSFSASAEDNVDGLIIPTCTEDSEDLFQLGVTSVTCTAIDTAGNISSEIFSISMEDNTKPEVQFVNIQEEQTLTDIESIHVEAFDNVGISKVEFYIDGKLVDATTSDNFLFTLDTKNYLDGQHVIKAKAYDTSLNQNEVTANVGINNVHKELPIIEIRNISENETIKGSKKIQINVENFDGDSGVQILIDGNVKKVLTTSPYQFHLNSNKITPGGHIITAQIVYDGIVYEDSVKFFIEQSKKNQK